MGEQELSEECFLLPESRESISAMASGPMHHLRKPPLGDQSEVSWQHGPYLHFCGRLPVLPPPWLAPCATNSRSQSQSIKPSFGYSPWTGDQGFHRLNTCVPISYYIFVLLFISISISIFISTYIFLFCYLYLSASIYPSIYRLFFYLINYLLIYLSIYLPIYLFISIYLFTYLSMYLSIYLYLLIHLFRFLFPFPSLSICISLSG